MVQRVTEDMSVVSSRISSTGTSEEEVKVKVDNRLVKEMADWKDTMFFWRGEMTTGDHGYGDPMKPNEIWGSRAPGVASKPQNPAGRTARSPTV